MITIRQAQQDRYANKKENIFLAFNDMDQCLGSGYVYPMINRHQTYETPYLIFIGIDVKEQPQAEEIRQQLFENIMERAKVLRKEKAKLRCRIYAGFECDPDKMEFYIRNGFNEDYSIFMEADLTKQSEELLPQNIKVKEFSVAEEEEFKAFKKRYDEIFVTPVDEGFVEAQKEDASFKNFKCYSNEEFVGEFSLRVEGEYGWIEILYVVEEQRGKGFSKLMMNYIHQYFRKMGLHKSKLEVWELDKRAVNLYQSFGYQETKKSFMFPGITL